MIYKHFVDDVHKWPWAFFLHRVKWFQVLLYNSHNLSSVICLHTVCSIWPTDRTLSNATTPGQSVLESNGNVEALHIPQSSKVGASPSDGLMSYPRGGGFTLLQRCIWCILQPQLIGFSNNLTTCKMTWSRGNLKKEIA